MERGISSVKIIQIQARSTVSQKLFELTRDQHIDRTPGPHLQLHDAHF